MSGKITVLGLGPAALDQLTMGVYKQLKGANHLFLRTKEHPVVQELEQEGIEYTSFDTIYVENDVFENIYDQIVDRLLEEADLHGHIVYAVPGHPMVAERTVRLLLEKTEEGKVKVNLTGGQSFLDPLFSTLKIDPIEGLTFVDAMDFDAEHFSFRHHLVICQVYDVFTASEVKLSLLEHLPHDYRVAVVTAAGHKDEQVNYLPLHELDHSMEINNLTSVYVPPVDSLNTLNHTFPSLRKVIKELRGPGGCPWDKKQTHESLKRYLVEETYEVLEAIDNQDDDHLVEELGDVLLQVMLHSQIGEDEGYFTIHDVIRGITDKMIRRHPHVFGTEKAGNADDVTAIWQEVKAKEKGEEKTASILSDTNQALPPLLKALDYQKRAAKAGFDWPDIQPVWDKVKEELEECYEEEKKASGDLEGELGDLLFSIVNVARWRDIDPLIALQRSNHKFQQRFNYIEQKARSMDKHINDLSLEEMDQFWEEYKKFSHKEGF
ncbi:tetrapyrrole methylase family protein/MazG family protein [Scopulibacillus darangshiensis]|uniref:Tetrapyrrole methylase family protein/MazG family protein n=1 Tax=Scopulibacillus darangshiensis TaxID=442528 RepID=A0A4R2NLN4_9BACL|nr:nucleoside triphosphate pyrophosphohydrolase [Scopulibacillus darangshiensis]TCP22539.1 tetrapyrrole methylase family protein/MazG family protein [Scopulibacillus darangshiensis]